MDGAVEVPHTGSHAVVLVAGAERYRVKKQDLVLGLAVAVSAVVEFVGSEGFVPLHPRVSEVLDRPGM